MSRKGNPYDNAMAENFFSILKTECIYRHKPKSIQEANELIDRYIYFYNHERIQIKNGSGTAVAAPLRLKLNILHGGFLYCLHNLGRFNHLPGGDGWLDMRVIMTEETVGVPA